MTSMPPLCKGSIILGTGCKRCERCIQAINDLGDPDNPNTARIIAQTEASFRRLFAWIAAGPFDAGSDPITRAGFIAEHRTQTPAGEFYHISNPGLGFAAYLRPDAAACLGWLKRIDLRGETTLHSIERAARVEFDPADPMFAEVPPRPDPGVAGRAAADFANSTVVRMDDPWLVAVRAALLEKMQDLTAREINAAAMAAVVAIRRIERTG